MNEKLIGDLWIEAQRQMTGQSTKEFANNFAALVVKQCANVSLQSSHREDDMGAIIARNIKELFGVEE